MEPKASRPVMPASYGILDAKSGGGLLPWSWACERLERAHNYFLSTVRPDGRPHVAPVWGCWMDDRFYFSTDRASVKGRNLAKNPHCVICPEHAAEAIMVEGSAAEVNDRVTLERYIAKYDPKYDWKSDINAGPFFSVRPRIVLAFIEGPESFIGQSTRWEFPASS
jgi:uncharacterized pyridoxamine 5'-phosphate oxidase family protein